MGRRRRGGGRGGLVLGGRRGLWWGVAGTLGEGWVEVVDGGWGGECNIDA